MMQPLERLAEGVSHGDGDSSDQSHGPLASGAGGRTQAQRGGAHRYLLSSASCKYPLMWPWRRGPAPGHSRWPSCPLYGGGAPGGARDAPLAPGWSETNVAERLPLCPMPGALCGAELPRRFCSIPLNALDVYALSTPWLHQDTTTITLYGAYEEAARPVAGLVPPRPAYGHSKDGRDDLKQVLLSLGVSSDGLPLRLGLRDGNTSDSTETPVAIEACLALGLDGVRGIVAESKAYGKRTLGLCLEKRVGLITLVPRPCAVRQALEAWGQQHGALPLLLEKPGRTRQEPPRHWHGHSVRRRVAVEYTDGRQDVAELRFLVVHSSQL